jgi:hypothetical protein
VKELLTTSGGEGNDHTSLDNTCFNTTDRHCANTSNLVNILERETEGLIGRPGRRVDSVNGLQKGLAGSLAGLGFLLPALVPWAVGGVVNHVVTIESRDRNECNRFGIVSDLLDEVGCLLDDFLETSLGPLGGVHLVDGNDELLDTKGISEEGVLTGLAILGDASLELTSTGGNDENSAVGLRGTGDHVLDEIAVTRGIYIALVDAQDNMLNIERTNNSDVVLGGLELPEGDIDGNTALTLGL